RLRTRCRDRRGGLPHVPRTRRHSCEGGPGTASAAGPLRPAGKRPLIGGMARQCRPLVGRMIEMAKDSHITPAARGGSAPAAASSRWEIEAFVQRARTLAPPLEPGTRGRLIFALDATMSRQPTWDEACRLQADMFQEAAAIGGLDVQL